MVDVIKGMRHVNYHRWDHRHAQVKLGSDSETTLKAFFFFLLYLNWFSVQRLYMSNVCVCLLTDVDTASRAEQPVSGQSRPYRARRAIAQ